MDTATTAIALGRADITALRTADDVYAVLRDDEYLLRCVKRKSYDSADPWATDQYHEIPCMGSQKNYDKGGDRFSNGFASLWASTGIWAIVRPGDRIRLVFSRGGYTTDNHRNAGIVGDSVAIEVIRKADVNGRKPLRFLGETYSGPDNSARICRY